MQSRFGIFTPVLGKALDHLALLHQGDPDTVNAVALIKECCDSARDPYKDISMLLGTHNWRAHLIGSVALALLGYRSESYSTLWHAFDTGSRMCPQLAVTAFLHDPHFADHAKSRIEFHSPDDTAALDAMTIAQKQNASKAISVLIPLLQLIPDESKWVKTQLASPDLQTLIAKDREKSARITENWLTNLKEILSFLQSDQTPDA
ncbi:MAG: hypothetical protein ABI443_11970 [Chthoniobacterales bacterium]